MVSKSLFFLTVAIVASSCHSVKYTERGLGGAGFYSSTTTIPKKHKPSPIETASLRSDKAGTLISTEVDSACFVIETMKETASKSGIKMVRPNNTGKTNHRFLTTIRKINKPASIHKNNKDNPEEGSIRWFIYLLLCFVLPPLAYYLIKRQTDTLFWVCFFCFLLTTTIFGGFRYGLLGLLSIVIALLTLFQIDI
jgi:hypothetical protein